MLHPLALPGMLAQTLPVQVQSRVRSMDSGIRRACFARQIPSLASWVTLDNLFTNLSCLFCRRGMMLLIHGIAACITYDQRAWQIDCKGKSLMPCMNQPCISQVLASVPAPSDTHFPPSGLFLTCWYFFFLLEYSPQIEVYLIIQVSAQMSPTQIFPGIPSAIVL